MTGQPSSCRQGHRSKEVAEQGAEGYELFWHLLGGSGLPGPLPRNPQGLFPETQAVLKPPCSPRFLFFLYGFLN